MSNNNKQLPRDLRKIVTRAREQGWRVELTRRSHVKFVPPEGPIVFTSGTPSDARGRLNLVSELRRSGLKLPTKSLS